MLKNIPHLYIANNALYDCNLGLMLLFIIVVTFFGYVELNFTWAWKVNVIPFLVLVILYIRNFSRHLSNYSSIKQDYIDEFNRILITAPEYLTVEAQAIKRIITPLSNSDALSKYINQQAIESYIEETDDLRKRFYQENERIRFLMNTVSVFIILSILYILFSLS